MAVVMTAAAPVAAVQTVVVEYRAGSRTVCRAYIEGTYSLHGLIEVKMLVENNIFFKLLLYYLSLCFEHGQIRFESLTFSLLSSRVVHI